MKLPLFPIFRASGIAAGASRLLVLPVTLTVITLCASPAFGAGGSRTWTGAIDGDFYNGGNWSPSGDFPNGNASFSGTTVNSTIERTSDTYDYVYGLIFDNTLSSQSNFTFSPGGTRFFLGGPTVSTAAVTSGSLTDEIGVELFLVGGAKTFGINTNHHLKISGNVTEHEVNSVTKIGGGTLILTGSNSYTGATTISGGTLAINGNISTSTTTVEENGTLAGIGTVGGVLVEAGGRLAIGNSAGTMTFAGDLTLGLNSISDFEIYGFGIGEYDLARARVEDPQITQTVNFNSGILNLLFQDGFNTAGSVKIFDFDAYDGAGLSTVNVTGLADGYSASFNTTNGIVTVIPEPSICLLGSLGALALLRRRR